jgi:hypothetical protein
MSVCEQVQDRSTDERRLPLGAKPTASFPTARLPRLTLLTLAVCLASLGWAQRASAVTFASQPFADNRPGTSIRDVVVRGTDNHVSLNTFNETNWNGWLDLGGDIRGRPTSVSFGRDHLDIYARDSANHLMHRWWNGTSFSNWESIGGAWQFVGDPIPVSWSNGRVDIFARGTDNSLIHTYTAGGGWGNWESLGGSLGYDPAVDTAGAGNLDIFAVTPNGLLNHRYFVGGWSTWQGLGPWQYTSPPSAATTGIRAGVFARGTDASADAVWWTSAGWGAPFTLGGGMTGQPSAVTYGDGAVIHTWFDGSAWHAWENLRTPFPTSEQYGGPDHAVNTEPELEAVFGALPDVTTDLTDDWSHSSVWLGLSPDDQGRVIDAALSWSDVVNGASAAGVSWPKLGITRKLDAAETQNFLNDLTNVQLAGGACVLLGNAISNWVPNAVAKAVAKVVSWLCSAGILVTTAFKQKVTNALNASGHPGVILKFGIKAAPTWTNPFHVLPYADAKSWNG